MKLRPTVVLMLLFFGGLGFLWWAGGHVPTESRRRELAQRLLPTLLQVPPDGIRRIEIASPARPAADGQAAAAASRIVAERRGGGRWQLLEPVDAEADPSLVETLARNLQELRKSPDSGPIEGDSTPYGLDNPRAVIAVFGPDLKAPLAVVDVGSTIRERLFVRPHNESGSGIEVVDARLFSALSLPPVGWRDRTLLRFASFRVGGLAVEADSPGGSVEVRRAERHWQLVKPFHTPADDDKVEGLVAELGALRVADGPEGFVADAVKDFTPYGLDKPSISFRVLPFGKDAERLQLDVGSAAPGKPDQAYARRSDQSNVVLVDLKRLRESYGGPNNLRSQNVAQITPARVSRLQIDALGRTFDLSRAPDGWRFNGPTGEVADATDVQTLLARLASLKTSDFLDPNAVTDARLDPPTLRIRLWQARPGPAAPTGSPGQADDAPQLDLSLGRNDVLKKTVYGRLEGDPTVLALNNTLLDVMPRSKAAFRNRSVLALEPARVRRLTVERPGKTATVESPGSNTRATRWRMVEPVKAAADETTVTTLVVGLSQLRAERWESADVGDGRAFGLDAPTVRVKWVVDLGGPTGPDATPDPKAPAVMAPEKALRVGRPTPDRVGYFANLEGEPQVFVLAKDVVEAFQAELHDPTVLRIEGSKVARLVVRWPDRTLAMARAPDARKGTPGWRVEPGYDPAGVNVERTGSLVDALASFKTPNFLQYAGPFPAEAGLTPPRLTVEFWPIGGGAPAELKIGQSLSEVQAVATYASGDEGPVFLVPTVGVLNELMRIPPRPVEFPDDPFAPPPPPG